MKRANLQDANFFVAEAGYLFPVDTNPSWPDARPFKGSPLAATLNDELLDADIASKPYLPLETRLAMKFRLRKDYYGADSSKSIYSNSIEDDFLGTKWERMRHLGAYALQAVDAEYLRGNLALEFSASQLCSMALTRLNKLEPMYDQPNASRQIVYHGSPQRIGIVEPRPANWQDCRGRRYADGTIAICASGEYTFPVMRALLNEKRPELSDAGLILSKQLDRNERVHWFTSERALSALDGSDGYVHAITGSRIASDAYSPYFDLQRGEYRIFGERKTLMRIAVNTSNLPSNLCIIDTDDRSVLNKLRFYKDPLEFGDGEGIAVRITGGAWPLETYA